MIILRPEHQLTQQFMHSTTQLTTFSNFHNLYNPNSRTQFLIQFSAIIYILLIESQPHPYLI